MNSAIEYVVSQISSGRKDIEKIKREAATLFKVKVPKNSDILAALKSCRIRVPSSVLLLLRKKPVRTLSGITTVAVMVHPKGSCKHECAYCPFTGKAAKSYTGEEPAALRARAANFDPTEQVRARLRQYEAIGHLSQKCEVIIMGGTFLEMPNDYKKNFIKSLYDAMNKTPSRNLQEAKEINESAPHRIVGLTIETRPDVCGMKEINEMLEYGATRVELGVQHPDNRIYRLINRGHTVKDVEKATALLKDSAFKVLYHIMPGLPGSNKNKDVKMIKRLFEHEKFRPDMLKIYPTLIIAGTPLYSLAQSGRYLPYSAEEAAEVISEMFRYIPKYVRVMRIQRDIPANIISSGVKKSNLRELVEKRIAEKGFRVNEIRNKEVGLRRASIMRMKIERLDYGASDGKEIFLSYENEEVIAGCVRLRIPGKNVFRNEITSSTALIRELHVYGTEEALGSTGEVQHRGIGQRLLAEAERVAKEEEGMDKIIVISGTGVRGYYKKLGYKKDGVYVSKYL
ncbi:MAG: tRNA uridine(34) 5-carboxymethylaminomethyl modification radical SAM/GNAT enzyme Elp3 [Candidatus Bilamarchaeaceae archaeon]